MLIKSPFVLSVHRVLYRMVTQWGLVANTLFSSLLLLYEKLDKLGFMYIDGQAAYPGIDGAEKK